ncbi:unnamed protein product [Heligmosomoides polygyrus]|uniref:RNA-directed DNA polymerase n=1 Tax=Heligmosomoides polygyrus TaxID=6339 RepID=A0A183FFM6_HELPZ|nr:unnamed protein product [Heligmosomoides polygyrus]
METKMLSWTVGVTRLDRVRNDSIRHRFGVTPIFEKMLEARLRWYGHVLRAKGGIFRKTDLNLTCPVGDYKGGQSSGGLLRCVRS